jgi:hypothetical protein
MHGAPAVSYPVGRSRLAGLVLAAAWLAGAAACAAWGWQVAAPPWQRALAAALVLLSAVAGLKGWAAAPRGTLAWSGAAWRWEGGPPAAAAVDGQVACALDLQRWLLLAWTAPGHPRAWLWLERERAPADWDALRRAVYSRARPEAPGAIQPPTAKP